MVSLHLQRLELLQAGCCTSDLLDPLGIQTFREVPMQLLMLPSLSVAVPKSLLFLTLLPLACS